jgi:hypothetical protein
MLALGGSRLYVVTGLQRLIDAKFLAAALELAEVLLRLLGSPALMRRYLDPASARPARRRGTCCCESPSL